MRCAPVAHTDTHPRPAIDRLTAALSVAGGFGAFRDRYPEWCEGSQNCTEGPTSPDTNEGELMGLRSLRISTPPRRAYSDSDSDSTCDSIGKSKGEQEGCWRSLCVSRRVVLSGFCRGEGEMLLEGLRIVWGVTFFLFSYSNLIRGLFKYYIKYVINNIVLHFCV